MKRLGQVNESLRLEKEMRAQKLNQYRSDIKAVNEISDMKRKMERNQNSLQQQHDRQRIQAYIDNEMRKNRAYNQHYDALNQKHQVNQQIYLNSISSDLEKKMQTIQKEQEGARKYNQVKAAEARIKEQQRSDMINGVYADNKTSIHQREHMNHNLRMEENKRNLELRDAMRKNIEDYQRMKREEAQRQKHLYKETLERQQQSKQFEKRYYGNMSRVEKEFNRFDLRSYKKNQNEIGCMIPGIRNIPSVGSRPTRGGDPLIKMQQDMLNSAATPQLKKNHTAAQLQANSSPSIVSDDKSKRERVKAERRTEMAMSQSNLYNPITNPLPGYQQNPYLLKQRSPTSTQGTFNQFTARRASNSLQTAGASVLDKSL